MKIYIFSTCIKRRKKAVLIEQNSFPWLNCIDYPVTSIKIYSWCYFLSPICLKDWVYWLLQNHGIKSQIFIYVKSLRLPHFWVVIQAISSFNVRMLYSLYCFVVQKISLCRAVLSLKHFHLLIFSLYVIIVTLYVLVASNISLTFSVSFNFVFIWI